MSKIYVYLNHSGFDFYLENREKTKEELFCPMCEEYDELLGVYDTEEALAKKLAELFQSGMDLCPGPDYDMIKEKYCPAAMLADGQEQPNNE